MTAWILGRIGSWTTHGQLATLPEFFWLVHIGATSPVQPLIGPPRQLAPLLTVKKNSNRKLLVLSRLSRRLHLRRTRPPGSHAPTLLRSRASSFLSSPSLPPPRAAGGCAGRPAGCAAGRRGRGSGTAARAGRPATLRGRPPSPLPLSHTPYSDGEPLVRRRPRPRVLISFAGCPRIGRGLVWVMHRCGRTLPRISRATARHRAVGPPEPGGRRTPPPRSKAPPRWWSWLPFLHSTVGSPALVHYLLGFSQVKQDHPSSFSELHWSLLDWF
jgi:hypothetical protein